MDDESRQRVTDVSLPSSGSALRSSAYSDAILHIRCHRHAGKRSFCPLVSLPLSCSLLSLFLLQRAFCPVSVLLESCHPEFLFGRFVLLSSTTLPPPAVDTQATVRLCLPRPSVSPTSCCYTLCHLWWAGDSLIWFAGDSWPLILIDFLLSTFTSYSVCCDYLLPSCADVW